KELAALGSLLASDSKAADRALQAVVSLSPLERCDKLTTASAPPVSKADPARLETLRAQLAKLDATYSIARPDEMLAAATALVDDARAVGAMDVLAPALLLRGQAQRRLNQYAPAIATVHEAVFVAAENRDDWTVARGWIVLLRLQGTVLREFDEGERSA